MRAHGNAGPKARKLVRTNTPGIFKRGRAYVVVFRDLSGKQRKRSARTLAEARSLKAQLTADVRRGEFREASQQPLADYLRAWIETYAGRTARGFREETRREYRSDLECAIAFFGPRMRLAEVQPSHIKAYARALADRGRIGSAQARPLAPASVKVMLAPLRAALADAFEESAIRMNPASGVRIATGRTCDLENGDRVKALSETELRRFLTELPDGHRDFFEFLAATGMRVSEAIAVQWGDLGNESGRVYVSVRRRFYKTLGPPKSKQSKRQIPLAPNMARRLMARRTEAAFAESTHFIFGTTSGSVPDVSNLFARVMKPAARRAGVPWMGFHTLRHTCASILFRRGANAKQVSRWLGHASPGFTLATYVHLLPEDLPDPALFDELTCIADDVSASPALGQTCYPTGKAEQHLRVSSS